MKNLKLKSALLGFVIIVAFTASAQPAHMNNCRHEGQNIEENRKGPKEGRMKEMLGLTDDQIKQIEKLRLDNQKKMLPLHNELNEKQARMKTLETADIADMKAINNLIDEMSVIKTKIAKERAANHQEIRKLLTDEQRLKFDTHLGKQAKHRNMMHKQ